MTENPDLNALAVTAFQRGADDAANGKPMFNEYPYPEKTHFSYAEGYTSRHRDMAIAVDAAPPDEAPMRAAFEDAWRKKYDMPIEIQFSKFENGNYQAPALNDCYQGWCMAHAAVSAQPTMEEIGTFLWFPVMQKHVQCNPRQPGAFIAYRARKVAGAAALAPEHTNLADESKGSGG